MVFCLFFDFAQSVVAYFYYSSHIDHKVYIMRTPIHPGEILADELEFVEFNASQLAARLHVPANRITQILKGQRAISADTALRLGRFFGTSAGFWMNLQKMYELDLARQEHGKDIETIEPIQAVA